MKKVLDFLAAISLLFFVYYLLNYEIIMNSNLEDHFKTELIIVLILSIINTARLVMINGKEK